MRQLLALAFALSLIGCVSKPPALSKFTWSRDALPPSDFEAFDEVVTSSNPAGVTARVWTTTYSRQDMSKAKAWVKVEASELVLCFSAPDFPEQPLPPNVGLAGAAYPTLLTYELSGSDYSSNIRFGSHCNGR